MTNKQNNKINESLFEGDLKWLVSDNLLIDMHKTKLGDDADYVVLSIAVNDRTPAIDLAQFIENSVYAFDDVEVSPGTDTKGRYLVYVEIERSPDLYKEIKGILSDVSRLSGVDTWKFKTMGKPDYIDLDEETFAQNVITSPEEYVKLHPPMDDNEDQSESIQESIKKRLKFLMDY